jgi:hypothetical protein
MNATQTQADFVRVIQPAAQQGHPIFCKVKYEGGELSISGVIGPKRNGDAWGGCGQIDMEFSHRNPADDDKRYQRPVKPSDLTFAPGWTAETWWDFLDAWKKYHLNNMKAGCEHQRATWNPAEEIEIVTYRLMSATQSEQSALKKSCLARLQAGETVALTRDEIGLLSLEWETTTAPDPYGWGAGCYNVEKREKKQAGWVRPEEHPRGLLCKPCEVCGYKYGSAWRKSEVPADVLDFLRNLPLAATTPAWV